MQDIQIISLKPTYKNDNGVRVFDAQNLPFPATFTLAESSFVSIPPGQVGGNHRHPRQEAFLCFQPGVTFHWIDANGKKHTEQMCDDAGNVKLFVAPAMVPHAVVNNTDQPIQIMDYGDGPLVDAEPMEVV